MKNIVIIVAGGAGIRMNSSIPKQFIELNGLPVLMHSIGCFYRYNPELLIRVVLPSEQMNQWENLCTKYSFSIDHERIQGGLTRFQSVKNGLVNLPACDLIAVHDGVRPLVNQETLKNCFGQAKISGTAIPVIDVQETIRQIDATSSVTVDRNNYKLVQTPQVFRRDILIKAYEAPFQDTFTDDASVVEFSGIQISLVRGNRENIKITTPVDLIIAENLQKTSI